MTFATPLLAAVAAAIAVPALIILYFLKLRRRDMEISSTLLWKKAIQDLQANAPFQKLRKNLLLFLQLIILACALFALAQPEFKDRGLTNQRQVILIDRSASMQSLDGGLEKDENPGATLGDTGKSHKSRLEDAKERALAMVEGLKEPGFFQETAQEAMVIAFDTTAEVRQAFTSNKNELRAAIKAIEPSDAPSSLERAFTLAKAYGGTKKFEDQVQGRDTTAPGMGFVATSPPASIHVFSDGRLPDAGSIVAEPQDIVVYHAVGSALAPNIGLTGLRAERAFDDPGKLSIFVGLQSTWREASTARVELLLDDQVVKSSDIQVSAAVKAVSDDAPTDSAGANPDEPKPEETWTPGLGGTVYVIQRPEGAIARVRISVPDGPDALEADNIGYLVIPPARRLSVCLVTSGNLFIRSVLDGMNLSRFDVKNMSEFQKLWDDDQLAQYDVFIFDRKLPERNGPAGGPNAGKKVPTLPPGRSLVLGAVPMIPAGLIDKGPSELTTFTPGAGTRNHPAIQFANLDKVTISKHRKVEINADAAASGISTKVLAPTLAGSPGIIEMSDATTLSIIVPFDVADTDWPFDPGWVLFLAGSTQYLSEATIGMPGAGGGGGIRDVVHAGETLSTRLPTGASSARIALPDDQRFDLEPGVDGSIAWGPISKLGIYTVSWVGQATALDVEASGRVRRPVAANLLSAEESDIASRTQLALASKLVQAQTQQEVEFTRKIWPWLLLGALAVVMFEWWIYNRKVML